MIIDCISDLHGYFPTLEGGDILIVAGDITARDLPAEYIKFFTWFDKQKYRKRILIAGNHDGLFENTPPTFGTWSYLCDSGVEFEGLKIWGSPYTPTFMEWHFMRDRGEAIKKHWDLIPCDTDILVTHGPPSKFLDRTIEDKREGCKDLLEAISRIRPKLHVFGHIHEDYGEVEGGGIHFVNCSHVNERYKPVNKPIRVILP